MEIVNIRDFVRPPVILCAGLPRSGSTWIYNAVLELCREYGNTIGVYSDDFPENLRELIRSNQTLVIKSHAPSQYLCELVRFFGGKSIVSVRDPRDCVVSLMEVFGFEKSAAIISVKNSADAIEKLLLENKSSIFVYEDMPDRLAAIMRLGNDIGYPVETAFAQTMAENLEPEKIRTRVMELERQGVLDSSNAVGSYTNETHWHPGHVGNGKIGKYINTLSKFDIAQIDRNNPYIMRNFNYNIHAVPTIEGDSSFYMSEYGRLFAVEGISFVEEWGVWSEGARTRLEFHFAPHIRSVKIEVHFFLGPSMQGSAPSGHGMVRVNNTEVTQFPGLMAPAVEVILVHTSTPNINGLINLEFNFSELKSPAELGINQDIRLLGIGLRRVSFTVVDFMA